MISCDPKENMKDPTHIISISFWHKARDDSTKNERTHEGHVMT